MSTWVRFPNPITLLTSPPEHFRISQMLHPTSTGARTQSEDLLPTMTRTSRWSVPATMSLERKRIPWFKRKIQGRYSQSISGDSTILLTSRRMSTGWLFQLIQTFTIHQSKSHSQFESRPVWLLTGSEATTKSKTKFTSSCSAWIDAWRSVKSET